MRWWVALRACALLGYGLAAAACGDDGNRRLPDAPAAVDAATDSGVDAPPVSIEGFASVHLRTLADNTSTELEAYLHAWVPGTAVPADVFGAYYPEIGTAMPITAAGTCATVAQPPFTNFASLRAGTLNLIGGTSPLPLTGPSTEGYYYGFTDTAAPSYLGPSLSIAAGADSEPAGGPGTLAIGALPTIAFATQPVTCSRATGCMLGATVATSDMLFVARTPNICRLDPAQPASVPPALIASLPDGGNNVTLLAIRRSAQRLGGGAYDVFLVHRHIVNITVTP